METITRVETFLVAPRWLFVRVETSGGLVGWGEASCEGRSETVRTAVHQLAEYLIGQDPFRIEDHWQVMSKGSFYRHGVILSSAVAGLDQALWDLLGKSVGLPSMSCSAARYAIACGSTAGWVVTSRPRSPTRSPRWWRRA